MTWFNQAGKKKSRRLARKAKAAAMAPRPVTGLLRPSVHCQTIKYASKLHAGRGFTLEELKEAGINGKQARSIGIAVDHRRTNLSVESLRANVQRLKAYKAKLILFPRGRNTKPKNGDSPLEATNGATQLLAKDHGMPIVRSVVKSENAVITEEMKNAQVFKTLREARSEKKLAGHRAKRAADAKKEKK